MERKNLKSIAVIGMSCRFPKAKNTDEFWKILRKGENVITPVPKDRWDMSEYYNPNKEVPNKTNQNVGGFLKNIHEMDPQLFNISPVEAYEMSPSQKLMMELAWEVIESSSIPYPKVTNTNTGVYIGNIWSDFEHYRKIKNSEINNFSGIGQSGNVIANRLSYFLGLTGPSYVLDTGCSSSLIAVTQCVEALQHGKIKMGIAGAINHILDPEQYVYLAKFGGLSSKGMCSTFDAEADGFVRAEGAGLILLKTLEDAERDGDKIFAVIRGAAMNNNGFNTNMPATSIKGQLELMDLAYKNAGVNPRDIHYIETHGTGTKLGDPVEAEATGNFFSVKHKRDKKLLIGSAKPNFGHTEGASGIAGLLKVILSMQNKLIPGNINFNKPNPKIKFDEWNLKVPEENMKWPVTAKESFKAGVSSFGWGGSNAHIVLEQYKKDANKWNAPDFKQPYYVLPLSARSEHALKEYAVKTANFLLDKVGDDQTDLLEFCSSFALRKPNLEFRRIIIASSKQDLIDQLQSFADSGAVVDPYEHKTNKKKVFIFPGQGSQWLNMGKLLYKQNEVFKDSINACEKAFNKYVSWSLKSEIQATKATSKLKNIDVIQPYIFAVQVSLAKMWISMGIIPDAIVGHSMGEVAAAYVAGILTLDDAAKVICTRSKLMATLSGTGGAMALTEFTVEKAEEYIKKYNGRVSVAVTNSPKSTVLAGNESDIKEIIGTLEEEELFCKQIKVDVASHSPQMDAIKEQLRKELASVTPQKAAYKLYSTVRNKRIEKPEMDADYWVENLRNTVQFEAVIKKLFNEDSRLFIEVSPHPVLKTAIFDCSEFYEVSDTTVMGSLHRERPEDEEYKKNFRQVFETGFDIDWNKFFNVEKHSNINLPGYPMDRKDYGLKDLSSLKTINGAIPDLHPLLNEKIELAGSDDIFYQSKISLNNLPYLNQHKVNNEAVFPGGFYIEMILFALKQQFPERKYTINNLQFLTPIILAEDIAAQVQLRIIASEEEVKGFEFYKKSPDDKDWILTCTGNLSQKSVVSEQNIGEIEKTLVWDSESIYKSFKNLGVEFGPLFQNVVSIKGTEKQTVTKLQIRNKLEPNSDKFFINPLVFDNMLHPIFTRIFNAFDSKNIITTFVTGIEEIIFSDSFKATDKFKVKTELNELKFKKKGTSCTISCDLLLLNEEDEVLISCKKVEAKAFDTGIEKPTEEMCDSDYLLNHIKQLEDPEEKVDVIQSHLITVLAKVTKAETDKINPGTTFKNLGIDSLTTVQLRNLFEKDFDVSLTIKDFTKYATPKTFAWYLYDLIKLDNQRATKVETEKDPWFIKIKKSKSVKHQILLFHDAGGSSQLFNEWDVYLPDNYELIIVELPGHGNRLNEKPLNDYELLMDIIIPRINKIINKPFSIFGHSMGGLIGFETASILQSKYKKTAENLIISGTPYLYKYNNELINAIIRNNIPDEQLRKLIPGLNENTDGELAAKIVRAIRADFELIYSYHYNNSTVLDSNIVALHAEDDDRVQTKDVIKWELATSKEFVYRKFVGGHSFVYNFGKVIAGIIDRAISKQHKLKTELTKK